jgi:hypothetical protein
MKAGRSFFAKCNHMTNVLRSPRILVGETRMNWNKQIFTVSCDGSQNQQWTIEAGQNDTTAIVGVQSGLCLDRHLSGCPEGTQNRATGPARSRHSSASFRHRQQT